MDTKPATSITYVVRYRPILSERWGQEEWASPEPANERATVFATMCDRDGFPLYEVAMVTRMDSRISWSRFHVCGNCRRVIVEDGYPVRDEYWHASCAESLDPNA